MSGAQGRPNRPQTPTLPALRFLEEWVGRDEDGNSHEQRIRTFLHAAYSILFLYAVTPREQLLLLPVFTLTVSAAWLALANIALPLALRRVEAMRRRTEGLLQQQFPGATVDEQLQVQPAEVMLAYWQGTAKARFITDLNCLAFNAGLCALMHKRFVGRIVTMPELLMHQAPLLLSKLLLALFRSRGPRCTFVLLVLSTMAQMYIRVVVEVKGFSLLHEYGLLGAFGHPFAYAFGMISVAPQTASGDWTTTVLWTMCMIVVDGMFPLLRCWDTHGELGGFKPPVRAHMLLFGVSMLPSLAAGLLLWYSRAMNELMSVQGFLRVRSHRVN